LLALTVTRCVRVVPPLVHAMLCAPAVVRRRTLALTPWALPSTLHWHVPPTAIPMSVPPAAPWCGGKPSGTAGFGPTSNATSNVAPAVTITVLVCNTPPARQLT